MKREEYSISDIDTAASDYYQQHNGWKTFNARLKSQYCVYKSRKRSLFSGDGSRGLYSTHTECL